MRTIKSYNEEFRRNAVRKLLLPGAGSLNATAESLGIPMTTLFSWKRKYATDSSMKKTNKKTTIKSWTADDKLQAIIETASMSEHQLGEYLRKNGLHSANITQWKNECASGLKSTVGRPRKDDEVVELRKTKKALERDLHRKDKALAEMSARIVLLKKSHLLWGAGEEDE